MSEEISEACGIFGAISNDSNSDVFPYLYWGLLSLNHRGQQSYGFTTLRNGKFVKREDLDLIPTNSRDVETLGCALKGSAGISNARYATSGSSGIKHLEGGKQPLVVSSGGRTIAISYNGNVVNASALRRTLRERFGRFKTDADTEVLAKRLLLGLEENSGSYEKAVGDVLDETEGAYSVMVLDSSGSLFAFRDVHGIRPYCYGIKAGLFALASETPALDINEIEDRGFVAPGELISVAGDGKLTKHQVRTPKPSLCSFEFAYFSRPDAVLNGTNQPVYKIREAFARSLAKRNEAKLSEVDIILSMPETADDAAYGLHATTGIPWERAVRKNRYVTRRAFISGKDNRERVIDKKMNIVSSLVEGKNLAVVEDSIVRGDTTRINIAKLRKAGAKRIDVFVTFPKIANPCLYGVDMSTYGELLGAKLTPEEISKWMNADSVNYQTLDGLVDAIGLPENSLCAACVTGKYPTKDAQKLADEIRAKFLSGVSEEGIRIYEKDKVRRNRSSSC
jgi:amidophosphoribosyltransferase